jgi:putative DNA methylase
MMIVDSALKELLIEKWFPVHEASIESGRERSFAFLPPLHILHLWWARRPLTVSRIAAVLAALPSDAYKPEEYAKLLYAMGLRGDPIKAIEDSGNGKKTFGYPVFEAVNPTPEQYIEKARSLWGRLPVGGDYMAGGGSIPFEMARSGYSSVVAGDLNPVAYVILRAGLEYPSRYGERLVADVERYGKQVLSQLRERVKLYYQSMTGEQPTNYIWVKTFKCPECGCDVPAVKQPIIDRVNNVALYPRVEDGKIRIHIVKVSDVGNGKLRVIEGKFRNEEFDSRGYVQHGVLECPLHRHTISGEESKRQYKEHLEERERAGFRGSHPAVLTAVVFKGGKFAEPTIEMLEAYQRAEEELGKRWSEYIEEDLIPTETIPVGEKTGEPLNNGINKWYGLFNARQLIAHAELVRLIREARTRITEDETRKGRSQREAEEYGNAVATYLNLALGKLLDYNSVLTSWHAGRNTMRNTFDSHAYAWTWDHVEGDMMNDRTGYSWCIKNTLKALKGLTKRKAIPVKITVGDAAFPIVPSGNLDVIITDPPYYGNVQYAEISDYFYVWFKRALRDVYPDALRAVEVPKQEEAVANRVRHGGSKLADTHYEAKMTRVFTAMNHALVPDGAFILWFAHKTGAAWSSTINALLNSGFTITALWGVRAEMEHSIHITGKASLKTNILMVCRKRTQPGGYIQDVLSNLESTIEPRLKELESYGIDGPDFIMGAQAEALKAASQRWPLKDPEGKLKGQEMLELVIDQAVGFAVNHVTRRIAPQLTGADAPTKFYILARYLYKDAATYDDARRLALACLGTTGTGDPVKQIAIDIGLGELTTESVSGVRAKVLTLTDPVERFRNGRLASGPSAPIIDHIHRAIALLQEGKTPTQAAEALSDGGPTALDALNALYQAIPEGNPERVHIQTLLITIGDEPITQRRQTPSTRESKLTEYTEDKK